MYPGPYADDPLQEEDQVAPGVHRFQPRGRLPARLPAGGLPATPESERDASPEQAHHVREPESAGGHGPVAARAGAEDPRRHPAEPGHQGPGGPGRRGHPADPGLHPQEEAHVRVPGGALPGRSHTGTDHQGHPQVITTRLLITQPQGIIITVHMGSCCDNDSHVHRDQY